MPRSDGVTIDDDADDDDDSVLMTCHARCATIKFEIRAMEIKSICIMRARRDWRMNIKCNVAYIIRVAQCISCAIIGAPLYNSAT